MEETGELSREGPRKKGKKNTKSHALSKAPLFLS